jgi:hypothetical protein
MAHKPSMQHFHHALCCAMPVLAFRRMSVSIRVHAVDHMSRNEAPVLCHPKHNGRSKGERRASRPPAWLQPRLQGLRGEIPTSADRHHGGSCRSKVKAHADTLFSNPAGALVDSDEFDDDKDLLLCSPRQGSRREGEGGEAARPCSCTHAEKSHHWLTWLLHACQ